MLILCSLSWCERKSRYLSVCVGFLYTSMLSLSLSREIRVSRNGSWPFDSCSTVKEMCGSIEFSELWKEVTTILGGGSYSAPRFEPGKKPWEGNWMAHWNTTTCPSRTKLFASLFFLICMFSLRLRKQKSIRRFNCSKQLFAKLNGNNFNVSLLPMGFFSDGWISCVTARISRGKCNANNMSFKECSFLL